jgi:hypothetical protein
MSKGLDRDRLQMQTSTPQGEEVFAWLAEQSLSIYGAVFAKHKLDTLRKVSLLTPAQLDTINADLNAVTGSSTSERDTVQEGQRVALGEAVDALRNSPQAMSLKERLRTYRDPTVSGLNLVGAQNQIEVLATKTKWLVTFIVLFLGLGLLQLMLSITGTPKLSVARSAVVKSVSVQVSNDSVTWHEISCGRRPCIFDTRPAGGKVE